MAHDLGSTQAAINPGFSYFFIESISISIDTHLVISGSVGLFLSVVNTVRVAEAESFSKTVIFSVFN